MKTEQLYYIKKYTSQIQILSLGLELMNTTKLDNMGFVVFLDMGIGNIFA